VGRTFPKLTRWWNPHVLRRETVFFFDRIRFCKFSFGHGVPQNYGEALKWYKKAAEQGLAFAQLNLAAMYKKGEGVLKNYVKVYAHYSVRCIIE